MKRIIIRVSAVAALVLLGWAGYHFIRQLPQQQREVATTVVRRGDVVVRTFTRGELRAVRSMMLTAPNLFGTVQVTRLAPLGSYARKGDLVVEFDDSEVQSRLEEKQLELDQIDEQIKKAEADLTVRANQDDVELLRARYAVRRGELEVQRNEIISAIDAKKNDLNLTEAKQRLEKLKSDIQSRRQQAEAELDVLREKKRKAELERERELRRLERARLLAPMSGLVAIRQARGHFFFAGTQMPDIREGDELRPGMPVADILDLSELEVSARVGELDRANLSVGQKAVIRLDALAGQEISGRIKSLSGTASADIYSNDPAKKFDVVFEIDMRQLLTVLGASPDQIDKIMARAEENRKRSTAGSSRSRSMPPPAMMSGPPPAMPGGGPGAPSGLMMTRTGQNKGRSGRRGRQSVDPARILARLPDDQRGKAQKVLDKELKGRKWKDLPSSDKRKVFKKLRPFLAALRRQPPGGTGGTGARSAGSQFTKAQIAAAKLPPPPEQDTHLDVLLRPGLLADVEIIVENIPNAIHIPVQAVFEKDNKPIVYVKTGKHFEARFIKPLKQSESTMVVAEGLKEGEIIALADPNAKPGAGNDKAKPSQEGTPMSGFGGGKSGGGRRNR